MLVGVWAGSQPLIPMGERSGLFDAHRDDGKRFVVHADEKLTAFVELESTIRAAERPEDCGAREIKLDKVSRIT
jgi:hypothetical protein